MQTTPTLAAWIHDLSPFLVRFSGDLGIRWYGLAYAAGFAIAWMLLSWMAKRGLTYVPYHRVTDAILAMVVGVVLGGRLGYVLFYDPALLWTFSHDPPWWGVLMVNHGGMASHGGMIGVILACYYISRRLLVPPAASTAAPASGEQAGPVRRWIPAMHLLDVMALLTPFGLFLGRLANFVNGELLGRVYSAPGVPAPWWTVRFPQERFEAAFTPELTSEQSLQLEGLIERNKLPAETMAQGYRSIVQRIQHGDHRLAQQLEPLLSARYPSQLFQAIAEGLVLGVALWLIWREPRRPGVVGVWFLIIYGILRVVTEFWRLPDAHLAVKRVAGLSRGQWLSVLMVVVGVAALAVIVRKGGEKIGGWGPRGKRLDAAVVSPGVGV